MPGGVEGSNLRPKMLRRFASALMIVLLAGTLLAGASARGSGRECPMRAAHDCCKKAHAPSRSPEAAAARLCCLVNCPQPAPTGANFTFRSSSDSNTSPRPTVARAASLPHAATALAYAPPFQPSLSPPAYIQHLALLI